ncbi:hypothetical protein H257_17678 [Aphanomyces astaci]|uniref:Uncharacterized protein n=1 Tax=Aphanomyces astaci TaxID=112090 RepID=W4FFH6_APHAT|nr:hypothetical protein H257_17678 [Aphanomyces astaci]ETV65619.1 hypothetical protein H257_17678 [Aphanomyces astaci]|eukprot:XP_009844858.1 hypothetical protein H257_17678 [Aphanomyces astaci]
MVCRVWAPCRPCSAAKVHARFCRVHVVHRPHQFPRGPTPNIFEVQCDLRRLDTCMEICRAEWPFACHSVPPYAPIPRMYVACDGHCRRQRPSRHCVVPAFVSRRRYAISTTSTYPHSPSSSLGCTKEAMDAASFKGFLDVVQFLHRHRKEGCTKSAMTWAARLDQLQVVRFLDENRTEGCTKKALDWAAKHGHLNVVKYLHEHRQEGCPEKALLEAAKAGHMHIVRYLALHAKDLHAWMHRAMQTAVAAGHLKHVRALVEQGGRCATSNDMGHVVEAALETAMDTGHTAIAHYLLVCYSQLTVLK